MFAHSVFPASVFFGGVFPPAVGDGPGPTPEPQTYGGFLPPKRKAKNPVIFEGKRDDDKRARELADLRRAITAAAGLLDEAPSQAREYAEKIVEIAQPVFSQNKPEIDISRIVAIQSDLSRIMVLAARMFEEMEIERVMREEDEEIIALLLH